MLTHNIAENIASVADPYPERSRRVSTSLALRPEDHKILGQLSLDTGIDRASIVRRALVLAGILPAADVPIATTEAAGA